jgi:hypothetical protein
MKGAGDGADEGSFHSAYSYARGAYVAHNKANSETVSFDSVVHRRYQRDGILSFQYCADVWTFARLRESLTSEKDQVKITKYSEEFNHPQ